MNIQILLAEDNDLFRTILASELAIEGYEVTQVADGNEALERLHHNHDQGHPYQLLVTDLRMPNVSGLELIRSMGEHGLDIPTVIMTADVNDDLVAKFTDSTVMGFLQKPFAQSFVVLLSFSVSSVSPW